MAKVMVSIDDGLLSRIDNYADNNYMSRSGLITQATNQFLNSVEVVQAVKDMSVSMRKIADGNMLDDEIIKELEHFEFVANNLVLKN